MKISTQTDGFLCGLLDTNALARFYLPKDHPLINVATVDTEHVRIPLRVVQRHLDQAKVC